MKKWKVLWHLFMKLLVILILNIMRLFHLNVYIWVILKVLLILCLDKQE